MKCTYSHSHVNSNLSLTLKCPFGVFKSPPKKTIFFSRISALASKRGQIKKYKDTLYQKLSSPYLIDSKAQFFCRFMGTFCQLSGQDWSYQTYVIITKIQGHWNFCLYSGLDSCLLYLKSDREKRCFSF